MEDFSPKRIICLTEETTETLYLLGEEDRIVGISGFTMRPSKARKEKPKVSAFTSANIEEIIQLKPDLVIGFSDIQADIAKELISRGITVWVNNHRSVQDIYAMMAQLGFLTGKTNEVASLIDSIKTVILNITESNRRQPIKPKVYFEEWFDPLISGIRWVSELIEMAGGVDIFSEFQSTSLAKDRIIEDPEEVVRRNPDIIIASWCGKQFKKDRMLQRDNWTEIKAVKTDFVFEIESELILQPGPAALTDGIQQIVSIVEKWHKAMDH